MASRFGYNSSIEGMKIKTLIGLDIKELNKAVREQKLDDEQKKTIKFERRKKKVREYSKQKYVRSKTKFSKKVEERNNLRQQYQQIMEEIELLKQAKACFELADTHWNFDAFDWDYESNDGNYDPFLWYYDSI